MTGKIDEQWRMFCAIELGPDIRSRIENHIEQLRAAVPMCQPSWTRVENIHLTLKFFGNVDVARVGIISKTLLESVKAIAGFEIAIGDTGAFPLPSQPRVLWIGVNDTDGHLGRLHEQIEQECGRRGFERESRAYRPHLTIARLRKPHAARALADANLRLGFEPMKMPVSELLLFRSDLTSKGSKYTVVSRHSLSDKL